MWRGNELFKHITTLIKIAITITTTMIIIIITNIDSCIIKAKTVSLCIKIYTFDE
jgi:hypothetical protein